MGRAIQQLWTHGRATQKREEEWVTVQDSNQVRGLQLKLPEVQDQRWDNRL